MNEINRSILEEYRRERNNYILLGALVQEKLEKMVREAEIPVMGIEHRIKTEESLEGKLFRYPERFHALEELKDLLGARIICFFPDEVDRIGALLAQLFEIDWKDSSDKRALHDPNSFGYLSLHYICMLPSGAGYPEELCQKRFEVQIRTVLQHAWAAINHDLGYKSEFGVPREITRRFSRLAGLLELADDEFARTRDEMHAYTEETRTKIIENRADDVRLDMVSLREYMLRNQPMQSFLSEVSEATGAEIAQINPESYLPQLAWLGKRTIGDMQRMLEENSALALWLVRKTLAGTELDILSSNAALRYLCRAELMLKGYSEEKAAEFIALSVENSARAARQAARLAASFEEWKGAKR